MSPPIERGTAIAVLPFRDLSPERDRGYLALGFTEDLLVELTRFPSLDVLSGRAVVGSGADGGADLEQARELGVAYVLQGSVRREGAALRVSAQLVEVNSGRVPWAEAYDARIESLFDIQDEIVARVAGALAVHLDEMRLKRARRTPLGGLGTSDCWLRGLDCLRRGTLEADEEAREYFSRAIELDGDFARAWAGLSLSYFNEWSCQVWHLFEENGSCAFEHALRAVDLDDGDALVHLVLGRVRVMRREFETARRDLERALALGPNDPDLLAHLGLLYGNLGEPERALELARRARRLNRLHPDWYFVAEALPLLLLRRFEEGLEIAVRAGTCFVDAPAYRAVAAALLGSEERARRELASFDEEFRLKITFGREPEPGEQLRWLLHVNPFRRPEDEALFLDGLHRAGIEAASFDPGAVTLRAQPAGLPIAGNLFRREAATWTVAFEGSGARLAELKGFFDLAQLLRRPNEPVHCLQLQGAPVGDDQGTEVLDARTRREIEGRIEELGAELADGEERNDIGRADKARSELEALRAELARAFGLGGRPRRMGDPVERARTAVTWRIRSAIKKVKVAHPRLGQHLEHSVKTGTFCVYAPERPTEWLVETAA